MGSSQYACASGADLEELGIAFREDAGRPAGPPQRGDLAEGLALSHLPRRVIAEHPRHVLQEDPDFALFEARSGVASRSEPASLSLWRRVRPGDLTRFLLDFDEVCHGQQFRC